MHSTFCTCGAPMVTFGNSVEFSKLEKICEFKKNKFVKFEFSIYERYIMARCCRCW